jgi:hypothetical protein
VSVHRYRANVELGKTLVELVSPDKRPSRNDVETAASMLVSPGSLKNISDTIERERKRKEKERKKALGRTKKAEDALVALCTKFAMANLVPSMGRAAGVGRFSGKATENFLKQPAMTKSVINPRQRLSNAMTPR